MCDFVAIAQKFSVQLKGPNSISFSSRMPVTKGPKNRDTACGVTRHAWAHGNFGESGCKRNASEAA